MKLVTINGNLLFYELHLQRFEPNCKVLSLVPHYINLMSDEEKDFTIRFKSKQLQSRITNITIK